MGTLFWSRFSFGIASQDNGESHSRCWRLATYIMVLLDLDIGRGAEVVDILDRAKIKPSVAVWAHLSEYED